jgi:hypothetical protein
MIIKREKYFQKVKTIQKKHLKIIKQTFSKILFGVTRQDTAQIFLVRVEWLALVAVYSNVKR